jgi:hypothetical protein
MGIRTLLIRCGIGVDYFADSQNKKVRGKALQAKIINEEITPQKAAQEVFAKAIRFNEAHYLPGSHMPLSYPEYAELNNEVIGPYRNALEQKSADFKLLMAEELRRLAREKRYILADRLKSSGRVEEGVSPVLIEKTEELIRTLGLA